jgi:hypothetical protein
MNKRFVLAREFPPGAALWLAAAALCACPQDGQAPAPAATPLSVRVLEAPINVFDVAYGYYGGWVASDGIGDRLLDLAFDGSVLRSDPLNLLVINLYPANQKYYFNALDSVGRHQVGYRANFTSRGAILQTGFLSQGSSLAVRPDENGATASRALSGLTLFKSDFLYSLNPISLQGQPRGMDYSFDAKLYVGFTTGIRVFSQDGTSSPLAGYSGNVNAVRGCGDRLWVGTTNSLDWVAVANGTASVMRYPTTTSIFSVDCGGNGSVVATGDLGSLYYINPTLNVFKSFQVQGAVNLVKIALGPGRNPRGLLLDFSNNQGTLKSFGLTDAYSADRDTAPVRLPTPTIRLNF